MTSFLDPENVCLKNLAGGAALERFDHEFERVLKNICDPNTDPKKIRKIKLTITLKPSEDRDFSSAKIDCESTLAPLESFNASLYIGRTPDGKFVAQQSHYKQTTFAQFQAKQAGEPGQTENVKPFERKQS